MPAVVEASPDETQEFVYAPPQIVELLAVNGATFPLFSKLGLRFVICKTISYIEGPTYHTSLLSHSKIFYLYPGGASIFTRVC